MRVLRAGSSATATSPVDADAAPTWTTSITAASITATAFPPATISTAARAASKAARTSASAVPTLRRRASDSDADG
jgi:hypothetical protein